MLPIASLLTAVLIAPGTALSGTEGSRAPSTPQDAPPQYPQWSGSLGVGSIFTGGNSITRSANASFNAVRRGEKDRATYDLFWNWAEQKGTKNSNPVPNEDDTELTQRNLGLGAKYDYFSSKELYYYANGSGKVDAVAQLDLRAILGVGLGYQWKETETLKWGTELGLSYVDESFEDSSFDASFVAARLGSNLTCQISKSSTFEQVAELFPSLEDSEDVIAKLDNRLKMIITGKWIAQIQYVLDFDGSAPTGSGPGADGTKETDHRVVLSLGWSFGS